MDFYHPYRYADLRLSLLSYFYWFVGIKFWALQTTSYPQCQPRLFPSAEKLSFYRFISQRAKMTFSNRKYNQKHHMFGLF